MKNTDGMTPTERAHYERLNAIVDAHHRGKKAKTKPGIPRGYSKGKPLKINTNSGLF